MHVTLAPSQETNSLTCPFAEDQFDDSSGVVRQIGRQVIGRIFPPAKAIFEWSKNTFLFAFHGSAQMIEEQMKIPGTQSYYPFKEISVGDKNLLIITDPKKMSALLKESRFGDKLHGGREFRAIASFILQGNPLSTPNTYRHQCLKSSASANEFGQHQINKKTIILLNNARTYLNELLPNDNLDQNINFTSIIPYYTIRVAARAIFDTEQNFEEVAEKLEKIERSVNNWILLNPRGFIPVSFDQERKECEKVLNDAVDTVMKSKSRQNLAYRMLHTPKYSEKQIETLFAFHDKLNKTSSFSLINDIVEFLNKPDYYNHFLLTADILEFNISKLCDLKNQSQTIDQNRLYQELKTCGAFTTVKKIIEVMVQECHQKKFRPSEIQSMIRTTFIIGSGTTKSAIISAIYELVRHPDIQNELYETISAMHLQIPSNEEFLALSESKQQAILDSINQNLMRCKKLKNFIYETMRLHTPIPAQARTTKTAIELDDELSIPAEKTIYTTPFLMHIDEKHWKNPLTFNPSRFENDHHREHFHPFNLGKNRCLGESLAWASIKSILSMLILHYEILPAVQEDGSIIDEPLEMEGGFTYKFNKDLLVRLKKRVV